MEEEMRQMEEDPCCREEKQSTEKTLRGRKSRL
jgi:hypothetical protein